MDTQTIILLVIPIIAIHVILVVVNLLNIKKKTCTKFLTKSLWIIIIIFIQIIGSIAYMVIEGGHHHDSN